MESGHMGGITVEEEAGNMSRILLIFFIEEGSKLVCQGFFSD